MRPFVELLLAAFFLLGVASAAPRITSLSETLVGNNGGTTLTIYGKDFSGDRFNKFDPSLGNVVKFVNQFEVIECDVSNYHSTVNKIVCTTRPRRVILGNGYFFVKVWSDGVEAVGTAAIKYDSSVTPKISGATPRWGVPGTMVQFTGAFQSAEYLHLDPSDPLTTPKSDIVISRAFAGEVDCKMVNDTSGQLFYLSEFGTALNCLPQTKFIGAMNGSIFVNRRGRSNAVGLYVDSKDKLFHYHTYPVLQSVSPSSGSSEGNTLLTLTGTWFDPFADNTQVWVGGAACEIQEVKYDRLTCLTPPQNEIRPASGGRGVLSETWSGVYIEDLEDEASWAALDNSHSGYRSWVLQELSTIITVSSAVSGKLSGYFHAPHDGWYSFSTAWLDDRSALFIAPDGNPDNKVKLGFSELVYLTTSDCYFELRYHSRDTITLVVQMNDFNAKYTASQAEIAVDAMQRVSISHEFVYEKQRISLGGPTVARIYLNGMVSDFIDLGVGKQIEAAVLGLTEQLCEVRGQSPNLYHDTDFESHESLPINPIGRAVEHIEPFCGRRSWKITHQNPRLYYIKRDQSIMANINTHPYMCFALRGNVQPKMRVQFRWADKYGRLHRTDEITINHGFTSTDNRWEYRCINVLNAVSKSWMNNHRRPNAKLLLRKAYAPNPVSERDYVYVDTFSLSSEDIRVVQTRPSALKSSGILVSDVNVVAVENEDAFDVEFVTANCVGGFPLLGVTEANGQSSWISDLADAPSHTFDVAGVQVNVSRTLVATHPVGGTWSMTIDGQKVEEIPYVTEDWELKYKIEAALGSNSMSVTRSGTCAQFYWDVTWKDIPGRKELGTIDTSELVFDGSEILSKLERKTEGRYYHNPLVGDFFTVIKSDPAVFVRVNGYSASCSGDCSFTYDDTGVPVLSSVSGSADADGSHTLTITGTGFSSSDVADYAVAVGDASCVVSAVTTTQVTCSVAYLPAGEFPVALSMQPAGGALQPDPPLSYAVALTVTSINPATGGPGGGYPVVVLGTGFPEDLAGWEGNGVALGAGDCQLTEADATSVTCIAAAGTGAVDVTVTVGGTSSSLSSGFTYDASLSASVTGVSPTTASVLGRDLVTISGSDLGDGTDGYVMVGDASCEVQSWVDTTITCILPPLVPGEHAVLVYTDNRGYASGSASVTSTLKVTASSSAMGSVNGGSLLVIQGEGFGSDCSLLDVDLGSGVMCDILQCSDTQITCKVMVMPQTHIVRNTGTDPVYGPGYSWEPKLTSIREGDIVQWVWFKTDPLSQLIYNVFQTSCAASLDYNGRGFHSGAPTSSGSYKAAFPHKGIINYASSAIGDNLVPFGQINVIRPKEKAYQVVVSLQGIQATYEPISTSVLTSIGGCTPILDNSIPDCIPTAPPLPDADHLYFITSKCFTPSVTAVSASATQTVAGVSGLQVAAGATLTITGSGLGSSICQNQVFVGDSACTVTASSDTSVTCDLDDYDNMISLKPFRLEVNVVNRGIASLDVKDFDSTGQVSIVPVVTAFSPDTGSLEGGTVITIQGTGLRAFDDRATVYLGSHPCKVSDVTPTAITCTTSPAPAGAVTVAVRISAFNIDAIIMLASSSSVYTYSEAATPKVTSTDLSGPSLTISGSGFGTDTAAVTVLLTSTTSRRKRSIRMEEPEKQAVPAIRYLTADINPFEEDVELEAARDTRMPRVRADLFGNMEAESRFWGKFTKTGVRTFEETKAAGAWRIGGSKRVAKPDVVPVVESTRVKRQTAPTTVECTPTSVSDTTISCSIADIPSGSYDLSVTVDGSGYASVESEPINATAFVTSISPSSGSMNGGALLTIEGISFTLGSLNVTVDGSTCDIQSETSSVITCLTPPHAAGVVPVVVTSGGVATSSPDDFTYDTAMTPVISSDPVTPDVACCGASISLSGTGLKLSADDPEVTVGGEPCTDVIATSTSVTCEAPELAAGSYEVVLRDTLFGNSNAVNVTYSFSLDSITPDTGGYGGGKATLSGTGFDPAGGSTVTVCGAPCEVIAGGFGAITCVVPPRETGESDTEVCAVVVTNPDSTTVTIDFTYDVSLTAFLMDLSPIRGGTAGGTRITIAGAGFASTGNEVTIGESICDIQSESSTEIVCHTNSHDGPGTFPVLVTVPGKGFAAHDGNGEFFYIDRWSSVFTWGGEPVPSEGQLVVIEKGQTVLLDESTEVLEMLLIKGGHFVFDQEASSEIVLRAKYILIVEGGSFTIGSEEVPFMGDAAIELYGNIMTLELPVYGTKVLAVREGTLDIHGAPIPVTWTHLASTANPGDSSITLKQAVTWKAGDNIVIATTGHRFSVNENEVRTIASVSGDGLTLTLTEPLEFEHISIEQTFGSRTVETRAEVGLLTRNIKIRGNVNPDFEEYIDACDSEFFAGQFSTQSCFNGRYGAERVTDRFGAIVMLQTADPIQNHLSGRLEYVEVTEAGQAFTLGRYPLHFHMLGDAKTSYIRGCSVHHTYNRAVTIHGTNYVVIDNNVVFNVMGHAIFLEDGIEMHNKIIYNLVVYSKTSSSLLNEDVIPAAYWITNPNNIVQHNAAAGGTHFGYWYRILRHPTGPSATASIYVNRIAMGVFSNNTAHSFGRIGLWIHSNDGYIPRRGSRFLIARFSSLTAWRCHRGAEAVLGGRIQFHHFTVLDNELVGMNMVKVFGGTGINGAGIFNGLVIGSSALTPGGYLRTTGVVGPKQESFSVFDTAFYNFNTSRSCVALGMCSQCKPDQGGYPMQVKGLSFHNAPNKFAAKWQHEGVCMDLDGSLTGIVGGRAVPHMEILPPSCIRNVAGLSTKVNVSVCDSSFDFLRLYVNGLTSKPLAVQGDGLIVSNRYGNMEIAYREKRLDFRQGWMALLFSGEFYDMKFKGAPPHLNIAYDASTKLMMRNTFYYVRHNLSMSADEITTTKAGNNSLNAIPNPVTDINGDFFLNETDRSVTYLVSRNTSRQHYDPRNVGLLRKIDFRTRTCEYEGCAGPQPSPVPTGRPTESYLWSDVETWKEVPVGSGGHPTNDTFNLPEEGDDIIIPPGMWLIVDTETPSLGRVYVYGGLEFSDTMDHVFNATIIFALGGSVMAGFSEDEPFNHTLNIVLRGTTDPTDPDNEDMPMPEGTPDVGWKAMGIFGPLALHGQCPSTTWMKLGATARVGDTEVTLAEAADLSWIGKQVVITATGKDVDETEVRKVVAAASNKLTLDVALGYEHLGETHTLSDGTQYVMAAEVGLLTRNIVIEGSSYSGLESDGFGGRVLVSSVTSGGKEYKGYVQLSCVEFRNMGQNHYIDSSDPRFALALHSLGTNDGFSYVKKCSFNKNFNSAIGVFRSHKFEINHNVVYFTVGCGIVDEGEDNAFRYNLVALLYFPGTFNGQQKFLPQPWEASFFLNKASGPILQGNVAAGSEMAGYRTNGEACEADTLWSGNEVHSATMGVMLWDLPRVKLTPCRRVSQMYAWRIWDTAFFMHHHTHMSLSAVMSVDNVVGVNQIAFGPHALTHVSVEKAASVQHSLFVGASPSYSNTYSEATSNIIDVLVSNHSLYRGIRDGSVGVVLATFISQQNAAPNGNFHDSRSYPAINGGSYITNVTFENYETHSFRKFVAIISNENGEDATHPIFVAGLRFPNTAEENKLLLQRPSVKKVNPSDCVDMACDGHKKIIITDTDGSFLGAAGATVTSEAEFEWDGDPRFGIGDYRIPLSAKMNSDGTQIPEADKFPNKGIMRDDSCTPMFSWRGWKCLNLRHRMMVIESMDADTEVRRLSPIAIIANPGANGTVDLLNGPMDRGWCQGYTCSERISTFYSVVATNNVYEMAMTGVPPQVMRLRLLHTDPSEALVLRIFFSKTQRNDVTVDGIYVPPTNIDNSKYPDEYQLFPEDDSYFPTINDPVGANYLQRQRKLFHVVLRGGSVIDITVKPTIVLSMGIVVDIDDFYEENIVRNLALLLDIAPENIRVTNVIRETVRRRLREVTERRNIELDIAGPPENTGSTRTVIDSKADILTRSDMTQIMEEIVNSFQENATEALGVVADYLKLNEPLEEPEQPAGPASKEFGSVTRNGTELYSNLQQKEEQENLEKILQGEAFQQPDSSQLLQEVPLVVKALTIFHLQPLFSVLAQNGSTIKSLGFKTKPWLVTAVLIGGDEVKRLRGNTTVPYVEGSAAFTDLFVTNPSHEFGLRFSVTSPEEAPDLSLSLTANFTVLPKEASIRVNAPLYAVADHPFGINLTLIDKDTNKPMDPFVLTGQEMEVYLGRSNQHSLSGPKSFSASEADMVFRTIEGLSVSVAHPYYRIRASGKIEPADVNATGLSERTVVVKAKAEENGLVSVRITFMIRHISPRSFTKYFTLIETQLSHMAVGRLQKDSLVTWSNWELLEGRKYRIKITGTAEQIAATLNTMRDKDFNFKILRFKNALFYKMKVNDGPWLKCKL